MTDLFFEYSNKQVTPFGGMILIRRFLDRTGINEFLTSRLELPESGSNAGYETLHIIQAFWVSIWLGVNRFAHTVALSHDNVLQKIFGWKRCPSDNTYVRFFKKLDVEKSSKLFYDLGQYFFLN